jgi:hypothetical protein
MGDASDIDSLIKDMNNTNLSNEENSMVNSILNELNTPSQGPGQQNGQKGGSQQQMPQITDEEKEMLMKQQMQQQQIAQQRMQQQMMQQQMMQQQQIQQQQQQQQQKQQSSEKKDENMLDTIKKVLMEYKEVIIVLLLGILFNLEIVSENMTMKNVSFMYDLENGKETFLSPLFKGLVMAVVFLVLKIFIK